MLPMCRPTTLQGLFDLKAKYNDAKLIVGNTEVGIEMKFKSMAYPHLVGVTHIAELNRIEVRHHFLHSSGNRFHLIRGSHEALKFSYTTAQPCAQCLNDAFVSATFQNLPACMLERA